MGIWGVFRDKITKINRLSVLEPVTGNLNSLLFQKTLCSFSIAMIDSGGLSAVHCAACQAAPAKLLFLDSHLPEWLPEITVERMRVGQATVTLRFYRVREDTLLPRDALAPMHSACWSTAPLRAVLGSG